MMNGIRTNLRRRWDRSDDGQVLLLFALFSFVLIGFMALSVDVGFLLRERRDAQAAADAGVLAAAVASMNGEPMLSVYDAGRDYAELNLDGSDAIVTVNHPPVSGEFAGDDDYLQVTVTKDVTRFFVGLLYTGDWEVEASAVAGIAPQDANAALLALNSDSGGIETHGSTRIDVINGSIVSNYNIDTNGSTRLTSDEWIWANDGFDESGSSVLDGDLGENPNAPEVPDPLLDRLDPPTLPSFPAQSAPSVNPADNGDCDQYSNASWMSPPIHSLSSSRFTGGGANCVNVTNIVGGDFTFNGGDYLFRNAGLKVDGGNNYPIILESGRYVFDGGAGIEVGGSTPDFWMEAGEYWFLDGAEIKIAGSAPDNRLGMGSSGPGDNLFYFSGGGGIDPGGSNQVTLYPGTYIFDGGPGIDFAGSSRLIFEPGNYVFFFRNGAGFRFSGSSRIEYNGDVWAEMYFYGDSNNVQSNCHSQRTQLCMAGSTNMDIPSGEYYFDRALMANHGSTTIRGENVFLYFTNGSYLHSSGSASFAFTAPDWEIYPGYYPGVFMYSDRSNTAEFQWNGTTSTVSEGIIYLPSSGLRMSGASNGKVFTGQMIADHFDLSGSNNTTVEFYEYVPIEVPMVYLVE